MHFKNPRYRLTYEAFSKYSGKLSRVGSYDELVEVTSLSLKYFFDFKQLRISVEKRDLKKIAVFTANSYMILDEDLGICDFEESLKASKVPIYNEIDAAIDFVPGFPHAITNYNKPKLWGWYFEYPNVQVFLSLISDEEKVFTIDDLDILRLLVETFSGKYQQLMLRIQLEEKNKFLEKALREIEEKNLEISNIISHQKKIIRKRTQSLEEKNLLLLELIAVNSHNLREPLTRILGLLELGNDSDYDNLKYTILPYIKESAEDLDNTIKTTINKSIGVVNKNG